jgi:2-dehydropantoate 2-reductase
MKIAIVGSGAMGCVYAGLLAEAGNSVWAIDNRAEHIASLRADGLRLEGASGDRRVRLEATTEPAEAGVCDLVVIATKAMHVEAAAGSARPLIGPETLVLSIQNGLGGPDKVAAVLDGASVAVGVAAGFGASLRGPGHAHHNAMELIRMGNRQGPVTPDLEAVAQVWRDAGFAVRTFDDIDQLVWEKLICNVCFSGTATLTEWSIAEIMADDDAWRVASGCAAEAYFVARAKAIALDFEDPVAYVHAFGSKLPKARPSMLLDVLEGRPSEIDAINGAIPPAGREVGVATPINDVVTALVRAKEARLGLR